VRHYGLHLFSSHEPVFQQPAKEKTVMVGFFIGLLKKWAKDNETYGSFCGRRKSISLSYRTTLPLFFYKGGIWGA
jgi:hypothetical protein